MSLYGYMNWPEIEDIVYSECDKPFNLLGGRVCRDGYLIQAFRPDAVEMSVEVEGIKKHYQMEKVDEAGYFAAVIPGKRKCRYKLISESLKGKKEKYSDSYSFSQGIIDKSGLKKFMAGTCVDANKTLGCHKITVDGTDGYRFVVWAPNARRVSVIGAFNNWDSRINLMQRDDETGVFYLFIPEIDMSGGYMYEVMQKNGKTVNKLDPFSMVSEIEDKMVSVCGEAGEFIWTDDTWIEANKQIKKLYKKSDNYNAKRPMSICELTIEDINQDNIVKEIIELGFNFVQITDALVDDKHSKENGVVNFFSNTTRIDAGVLKRKINEFHNNNIGVIFNWNCSMMSNEENGLVYFDGTNLYDTTRLRLSDGTLDVSGFDYSKPQVRSFLLSSLYNLIENYHADGIKVSQVSSMLYLDYGKKAGEWQPNIYGGHENLAALDFIKDVRKRLDKCDSKILLFAHEDSLWPHVTGLENDGLGFDYKWNMGWKKDIKAFIKNDPLFRKGYYERLSSSMLYQYMDDFLMELSDECPLELDENSERYIDDLKCVAGFMYTHPGKKLISLRLCREIKEYITRLNTIYFENSEMYEWDGNEAGFKWVDNTSVEETVIAYERCNKDEKTLVAINFTPVERNEFLFGIEKPGKYISLLDDKKYMSDAAECNGYEDGVLIDLKPLSVGIYKYAPYSSKEVEAIKFKKEAEVAKKEALKKAEMAKQLAKEAGELEEYFKDIQSKLADAKKNADEAQNNADKAQRLAKEKTDKAQKACKAAELS